MEKKKRTNIQAIRRSPADGFSRGARRGKKGRILFLCLQKRTNPSMGRERRKALRSLAEDPFPLHAEWPCACMTGIKSFWITAQHQSQGGTP